MKRKKSRRRQPMEQMCMCPYYAHSTYIQKKNNTKIVMFMAGLCIEMAVILQYGALADPILERPY